MSKWTDKDDAMRLTAMERKWADAMRTSETQPYIKMLAVGDDRDHPSCTAQNGLIVAIDHPWLEPHLPPHRKMCRCTFRTLSNRQMERGGLSVTPDSQLPE